MIYTAWGLSRFAQGVPVRTECYYSGDAGPVMMMVGHVQGFVLNSTQEVILKILWATGEVGTMHPAHVELL